MERPLLTCQVPLPVRGLQCNSPGQWRQRPDRQYDARTPSVFRLRVSSLRPMGGTSTSRTRRMVASSPWAQSVTDVSACGPPLASTFTPSTPFVKHVRLVWREPLLRRLERRKGLAQRVVSTFLPGVVWDQAKSVPSRGSNCVRDAGASGVGRTYVVDTTTAKVASWVERTEGSRPS